MTRRPITSFTVGPAPVGLWEGSVLVEVSALYVPTLLHRLEVYKLGFTYEDDSAQGEGLDLVNAQQEAILMDAADRIVSEVRALRDGNQTPAEARSPELDPYTLPLTSLRTIAAEVGDTNADLSALIGQTNTTLEEIKAALAGGASGEDVLGRLDVLIALLGTVA